MPRSRPGPGRRGGSRARRPSHTRGAFRDRPRRRALARVEPSGREGQGSVEDLQQGGELGQRRGGRHLRGPGGDARAAIRAANAAGPRPGAGLARVPRARPVGPGTSPSRAGTGRRSRRVGCALAMALRPGLSHAHRAHAHAGGGRPEGERQREERSNAIAQQAVQHAQHDRRPSGDGVFGWRQETPALPWPLRRPPASRRTPCRRTCGPCGRAPAADDAAERGERAAAEPGHPRHGVGRGVPVGGHRRPQARRSARAGGARVPSACAPTRFRVSSRHTFPAMARGLPRGHPEPGDPPCSISSSCATTAKKSRPASP